MLDLVDYVGVFSYLFGRVCVSIILSHVLGLDRSFEPTVCVALHLREASCMYSLVYDAFICLFVDFVQVLCRLNVCCFILFQNAKLSSMFGKYEI